MDNNVVVCQAPNIENFITFNRFLLTRTKRGIVFWIVPLFLLFLGGELLFFGLAFEAVPLFILAPLVMILMIYGNMNTTKKMMKSSRFYTEKKQMVYIFNDQGIQIIADEDSILLKWEYIRRTYETRDFLCFFQDTNQCFIISKENITKEQGSRIRKYMTENLDKKKIKETRRKSDDSSYALEESTADIPEIIKSTQNESDSNFDSSVITTLTLDAYIKFNYFHLFKRKNIILLLLFPFLLIIIGIFGIINGDTFLGILLFAAAAGFIPLVFGMMKSSVKRNFKSTKFLETVSDIFYGFNGKGILQRSVLGDVFFKWEQIHKVYSNDKYFYFYMSKMQSLIIDKADFTREDLDMTYRLIETNLIASQRGKPLEIS